MEELFIKIGKSVYEMYLMTPQAVIGIITFIQNICVLIVILLIVKFVLCFEYKLNY